MSDTYVVKSPPDIIYCLQKITFTAIFPEFFIGIRRTLTAKKTNDELEFTTTLVLRYKSEIFELKIEKDITRVTYITQMNVQNNPIIESMVQTHIAKRFHALLMLETGYFNCLMEDEDREKVLVVDKSIIILK